MSAAENAEIVRRQFERLNARDAEGAAALWAPESFNHGRKVDPAGLRKVYESLLALEESHTLHELVAEGDWVAVRTTCRGVHAARPPLPVNGGIFEGVPPTGRSYTNQHLHLFRVEGGLIKEHWATRDDLAVARQIGLELRPSTP